jgi:hypothetical protein
VKNKYTKPKFVVYDNITNEYLIKYESHSIAKGWAWATERVWIDDRAIFNTLNDAEDVIRVASVEFQKNGVTKLEFEVREHFVGSKTYEAIRQALVQSYGLDLIEYDRDHYMTAAVMDGLIEQGYIRE